MNLDVLASILIELGRAVWGAITHEGHGEEQAKAVARAAIDAAIQEAKFQAELAGIAIAHDVLDNALERVLDAFKAKGAFPSIVEPGNIEIVTEITDEDRKRERETWDNLKTPPERP